MVATRSGDKGSATHQTDIREFAATGDKHDMDAKPAPSSKRAKTNPQDKKDTDQDAKSEADEKKTGQGDTENGAHAEEGGAEAKKKTAEEDDKMTEAAVHEPEKEAAKEPGAVEPGARDDVVPSSILEKGVMYIFFRGRVGIEEPKTIDEVRRTYILLRPVAKGAKLGAGALGDVGNSRLVAIPKKALPLSGKQRWLAFVDKVSLSFETLRKQLVEDSEYDPVAEGVYAITSTGRESHLSYMLAHMHNKEGHHDIHNVQADLGVRDKGSIIISTRNPAYEAPPNAQFPTSPQFPEDIMKEFRSRRWMPTQPSHLDHASTQFLMVGEESGVEKALEPQDEDKKAGKEDPMEELEKLQDEDTRRMEGLGEDDTAAIFADLKAEHESYPKEPTFGKA